MIIQHNIPALNSYNKLAGNNNNLAKNLEKLSSGYRINRAADDAAGLAISEKMRAQITGLEVATKNAQDGVSLIQTAEGALQEVHSMLNRLVELASQSANGIYDDATDREYLQLEVTELLEAMNTISETDFNGINLLNGSIGGLQADFAAGVTNGAQSISVKGISVELLKQIGELTFTVASGSTQAGSTLTSNFTLGGALPANAYSWKLDSTTGNDAGGTMTYRLEINSNVTLNAAQQILADQISGATVTVHHGVLDDTAAAGATDISGAITANKIGGSLSLQVGDKSHQKLEIAISDMSAAGLGLSAVSVQTQASATQAIDTIKTAINSVNYQRDYLGAKQNRLEHTINNLTVTTENMTEAESRIRDTDMAKEMMAYTKNSILVQASQAMLAQANQLPSSVLNLLY